MPVRLVSLLTLVLLVATASAAEARVERPRASVGTKITLQKGIGQLRPGISEKRVRALLGRPNRVLRLPTATGGRQTISMDYKRKFGLLILFDVKERTDKVTSVVASHRQYRTAERLAIGATFERFKQVYPDMYCARRASDPDQPLCSIKAEEPGFERESQVVFDKGRVSEISVSLTPR